MAVVTNQPIQLSYFVQDITSALLTYNRLRWHRSRTGREGLYEPATAAAAAAAVITGTQDDTFLLNGLTLRFKVSGTDVVEVLFSDANPVSIAQVVAAIDAETALIVPVANDGKLQMSTAVTGSNASIEILDGDANPFLGFVEGDGAVGLDADTVLVGGTHEYFYTDQNSDTSFWYRTEFLHSVTADTTGLGVPFPANAAQHVAKSLTIVGYLRFSDMSGLPIAGRRVTFSNPFIPNTVLDQDRRWGIFRHFAQVQTDRNGYAEFRFIRGMTVDVVVDGTGFTRRIQIPSSGDVVDLFDPTLVIQDEFGIQALNIDFAIRTS